MAVGGWRDPSIGPLETCPARLARVIAILQCLIFALITLSPPGGSPPASRSAELGVITESEKGTYHRIRRNLRALPKLEAP